MENLKTYQVQFDAVNYYNFSAIVKAKNEEEAKEKVRNWDYEELDEQHNIPEIEIKEDSWEVEELK